MGTQLYKASKMSHLDFFLHRYTLKKKKKVLFLMYLFPVLQHSKRSSPCPTCYRRGGRKIRQPGDAALILHILISDHSPKHSYRGFKCSRNCRIVLFSHEVLEFPPPYSTRFVSQKVTVLRYLLFSLYTLKDLIYSVNWKHASNANRYQTSNANRGVHGTSHPQHEPVSRHCTAPTPTLSAYLARFDLGDTNLLLRSGLGARITAIISLNCWVQSELRKQVPQKKKIKKNPHLLFIKEVCEIRKLKQ